MARHLVTTAIEQVLFERDIINVESLETFIVQEFQFFEVLL